MAMFRNVMVYLGLGPDDEYDENYLYDEDNVDFEGLERRTGGRIDAEASELGIGAVRPLRPVPDGPAARPFSGADKRGPQTESAFDRPSKAADQFQTTDHPSSGLGESSEVGFFDRPSSGAGRSSEETSAFAVDGSFAAAGESGEYSSQHRGGEAAFSTEISSLGADEFSQSIPRNAKPRTVTPLTFDDAADVADAFAAGSPVAMNLRGADKETGRRLLDFTSGMVYGLGGGMEKIASNVFLITPPGVEVAPDDLRRLEERGFGR